MRIFQYPYLWSSIILHIEYSILYWKIFYEIIIHIFLLPVVLNIEIFRSDGGVDGIVQTLRWGYLVVRRPRALGLDDRLVYITLTRGQLSSSPFNPRTSRPPVKPIASRFIRGGLSVSLLYEFSSVGELLSSLLGVLCWEILFGSSSFVIGPRTLVKLCVGRRPGIEFGVWFGAKKWLISLHDTYDLTTTFQDISNAREMRV